MVISSTLWLCGGKSSRFSYVVMIIGMVVFVFCGEDMTGTVILVER
jgi:hypothetical protein